MKFICSIVVFFLAAVATAQEKKSIEALSITSPITIDGVLDEPEYARAQPARDFVQLQPYNGKPSYQPSEVYVLYDQAAVYIGAMLFDSSPDSIYNFLSSRDNIGSSDYFGVYFDPYNQGQLAYGFFITPAGVQTDIKAVKSGGDSEDSNWDAVWQSKTRVSDKGWVVELRIPYSALRFPENGDGTWGLNFFRNIRRYNSNNSWNFIDRDVSGFIHQEGQMTGIKNIKPPVRLSLSPYAAGYRETKTEDKSPEYVFKGGMDLKYGISEAFTLDMMLIPDFGQIQSDDQQLNLSPYELYYSEKRQFFTEGTELFERGNVFYSRRIGAAPKFSSKASESLREHEIINYNPTETQLLNATKVSGRTLKGWGLGMLNAMSLPSNAVLKDTITGKEREVQVQPFTNYNVAVIDKSLKNNSYVSIINTNMWMADDPFRANATATDFEFRDKSKTYALQGTAGMTVKNDGEQETGYYMDLGLRKNGGKVQYGLSQEIKSDKLNPNDMGYLRRNNEMITQGYLRYNILEPFWIFREVQTGLNFGHNRLYKPNTKTGNYISWFYYNQFKNNYGFEIDLSYSGTAYDYYEPRVSGRYYTEAPTYSYSLSTFSDSRKPIRFSLGIGIGRRPEAYMRSNYGGLNLNFRAGRHFQFSYGSELTTQINDRGYAGKTTNNDTIYFARRDVRTFENVVGATYSINNKTSLSLRVRHYWSGVNVKDFSQLQKDGTLVDDMSYTKNSDENYNAFNIDLNFRWIFAPGSELTVAWKNAILNYLTGEVHTDYLENLKDTWNSDQTNSLSIKVLYYIDYNNLRKKR